MAVVLDAGAVVAIERRDQRVRSILEFSTFRNDRVVTSAAVVGQVWRSGSRQANLARLLQSIEVKALDRVAGLQAGELLGTSRTRDVVDAHVALLAQEGDLVLTSDVADMRRLLDLLLIDALLVKV